MKEEVLTPAVSVLAKLGSIAVHADELMSSDGHAFDKLALCSLLADAEVKQWLEEMHKLSLVPSKRR